MLLIPQCQFVKNLKLLVRRVHDLYAPYLFIPFSDSPNLNLYLESIYSSQYDQTHHHRQSGDNSAVSAALLGFRFLATAAAKFAQTLDKCMDSYVPNTSSSDVFALFNASAAILDYVNYTQLHEQIEKYSFLSTNQLSTALALRPTVGRPSLVLRVGLSPIG
ncbi:unnamed protein product, partial [Dibothriocephalus latus]